MRLAIVGSRGCPQIDIDSYIDKAPNTIISGGAKGADAFAREYARQHSIELIEFLPEYNRYPPKVAPLIRNRQIVEACDSVLAFWDGKSRGTKYTLDYAEKLGKQIKVVMI